MAQKIRNLFVNSVPKRLIPLIIDKEIISTEKLINVTIIVISMKQIDPGLSQEDIITILSQTSSYFQILDYIGQFYGIEKVKSNSHAFFAYIPNKKTMSPQQQFQLASTFCLSANEVANFLNITTSAVITRGDLLLGVIHIGVDQINIESYGKSVDFAYKLSQLTSSAVSVEISTFYNTSQTDQKSIINKQINIKDNEIRQLCESIDFKWAISQVINSEPTYQFTNKKVIIINSHKIIMVDIVPTKQCQPLFYEIFEKSMAIITNIDNNTNYSFLSTQLQNQTPLCPVIKQTSKSIINFNMSSQLSTALQISAQENNIPFNVNINKVGKSFSRNIEYLTLHTQLKHSLIDELVNSDCDDDIEKIQSLEAFTEPSNLNSVSIQSRPTSEKGVEGILKPQLANFLNMAQNSQSIKNVHTKSEISNKSSAFNKLKIQANLEDTSESTATTQSYLITDNLIANSQEFLTTVKGQINNNDTIQSSKKFLQIQAENTLFEQLISIQKKEQSELSVSQYIFQTIKFVQLVSQYSCNQLKLNPSFFYILINRQSKFYFSFELQLVTCQFFITIFSTFLNLIPPFQIQILGVTCSFSLAYTSLVVILMLLSFTNFLFTSQFDTLQHKYQKEATKQNLKIFINYNTVQLRQYQYIHRIVFSLVLNLRIILLIKVIENYDFNISIQQHSIYFIIVFCFQQLQYTAIQLTQLLYYSAPLQFLTINFEIFVIQSSITLLFLLIQHPYFFPVFLFIFTLIVIISISSLKQHFINSSMNLKIGDQINIGRKLLKSSQPLLAMDAMLAVRNQQQFPTLVKQFPFLKKFNSCVIELKSCEQLFQVSQKSNIFAHYIKLNSSLNPLIKFQNTIYLKFGVLELKNLNLNHYQRLLFFIDQLYQQFSQRIQYSVNVHIAKVSANGFQLLAYPGLIKHFNGKFDFLNEDTVNLPGFLTSKELIQCYDQLTIVISIALGFMHDYVDLSKKLNIQKCTAKCVISFGSGYGTILGSQMARFDIIGKLMKDAKSEFIDCENEAIQLSPGALELLKAGQSMFLKYIQRLETQESVGGSNQRQNYDSEIVSFQVNEKRQVEGFK
eukprot:EST46077.1 Transmembrane domain-containing protein [Spironucleus salmonicida]